MGNTSDRKDEGVLVQDWEQLGSAGEGTGLSRVVEWAPLRRGDLNQSVWDQRA